MPTVHRTSRAETDLIEIWDQIARDDPGAADSQLDQINRACQMLARHPEAGPAREDLAPGLRRF